MTAADHRAIAPTLPGSAGCFGGVPGETTWRCTTLHASFLCPLWLSVLFVLRLGSLADSSTQ